MQVQIKHRKQTDRSKSLLLLTGPNTRWENWGISDDEAAFIDSKVKMKEYFVVLNQLKRHVYIQIDTEIAGKEERTKLELLRGVGHKVCNAVNQHKYTTLQIAMGRPAEASLFAMAEGCALSNYQFLKYRTEKKEGNSLNELLLIAPKLNQKEMNYLAILTESVFKARDLVNEPVSYLDAVTFAREMQEMGKTSGFSSEVLNKKQIQALKMGGLLAVNKGSQTPPTFTIMEWKPRGAKNKKPLVLIGKGVVYDTGGLSLKPTSGMDTMKCDMAGGALVAATMQAVAKAKLPYHVIGLVPATDNRPGEQAYTPGDVVQMYDGQTVEVLNTDAEGRMLLGDALAYAKKYSPELVLDFATLTGAAAAAIGPYGIVVMGTAGEKAKTDLKIAGEQVYERLVEFPFWDEYAKLLRSDIADMKNIGGPVAGAITAGKFLEKFTDYPWMHFDIAGPAYISSTDSYRGKNGTGVGVRLMFNYIRKLSKQ